MLSKHRKSREARQSTAVEHPGEVQGGVAGEASVLEEFSFLRIRLSSVDAAGERSSFLPTCPALTPDGRGRLRSCVRPSEHFAERASRGAAAARGARSLALSSFSRRVLLSDGHGSRVWSAWRCVEVGTVPAPPVSARALAIISFHKQQNLTPFQRKRGRSLNAAALGIC